MSFQGWVSCPSGSPPFPSRAWFCVPSGNPCPSGMECRVPLWMGFMSFQVSRVPPGLHVPPRLGIVSLQVSVSFRDWVFSPSRDGFRIPPGLPCPFGSPCPFRGFVSFRNEVFSPSGAGFRVLPSFPCPSWSVFENKCLVPTTRWELRTLEFLTSE